MSIIIVYHRALYMPQYVAHRKRTESLSAALVFS